MIINKIIFENFGLYTGKQSFDLSVVDKEKNIILDIGELAEREVGHIEGSIHIPLHELRDRLGELPKDKKIDIVYFVNRPVHARLDLYTFMRCALCRNAVEHFDNAPASACRADKPSPVAAQRTRISGRQGEHA